LFATHREMSRHRRGGRLYLACSSQGPETNK